MKCKTLRPFVNTLISNDKYFVLKGQYLQDPIHMQLSQKQKNFSECFSAFLKTGPNFEHIEKNMTVIANVFPIFWTSKNPVR